MRGEFKQTFNMRLLFAFLLIIPKLFILLTQPTTVALVVAYSELDNGGRQVLDSGGELTYREAPSRPAGQQDNIAPVAASYGHQAAEAVEAEQVISGDLLDDQHRVSPHPSDHHSSSEPLDDSALAVENGGGETNSLIESVLPSGDNNNNHPAPIISEQDSDEEEAEEDRAVKHSHSDGKNIGQTAPPSQTTGATAANVWRDNHGGPPRQHKNDWWCRRDCNMHDSSTPTICASDGRLYKSMCELRRRSCRHDIHLFKRPHVYCLHRRQTKGSVNRRPDNGAPASSNTSTSADQIRIIELKRRCQKPELDEMKSLLLREFNDDIESMFKYFDSNADGSIEAHELWPKQHLDEERRILYAQVRDQHGRCASNHSKCWYFVDFAFEPQFESNPCSLSHLMLFDLKQPDHRFSLDAFKRSFSAIKSRAASVKPLRKVTQVRVNLGDAVMLDCLPREIGADYNISDSSQIRCLWTRFDVNLAAVRDPHLSLAGHKSLHLRDAQLYLSGTYKCSCHLKQPARNLEHLHEVQVVAPPRVEVRPHYQWSLPGSRVSFECHYDYIDTSFAHANYAINNDKSNNNNNNNNNSSSNLSNREPESSFQFGLNINWLKDSVQRLVDSKFYYDSLGAGKSAVTDGGDPIGFDESPMSPAPVEAASDRLAGEDESNPAPSRPILSQTSARASITIASSRLTLERLQANDTGRYSCQVQEASPDQNVTSNTHSSSRPESSGGGILLVQEQPSADQSRDSQAGSYLWMFHDNGISVYRFQGDDSQEMELVSEINGHSLVDPEVDGNWNQLTLCGGLNPEQVVICEWSDNAIYIDIDQRDQPTKRRYIYVGQPNLNRVAVFDGSKYEIVAIINTEPQPRKLFLFKPNKVHLSKWVRRHLSPTMNARWLKSMLNGGEEAHPLRVTPDSVPYSRKPDDSLAKSRTRARRFSVNGPAMDALSSSLVQYDIWLLCYGQPLVVDPSGDERLNDPADFYAPFNVTGLNTADERQLAETIQPFTPRLARSLPFSWSVWSNKESQLRNRKSVHIIQSTFFPRASNAHGHDELSDQMEPDQSSRPAARTSKDTHAAREFKRSTVITSHHIFSGLGSLKTKSVYLNRDRFDLIHDLMVPPKPYQFSGSSTKVNLHKTHYAYVTHYGERRLFRVSMDEYRYDQDIDLQNCDPISMISAAQGLLVIQCRAPISHELMGQLVLDQLTNTKIEFNSDIRAQESFLSPDNRYLISLYSNSTSLENFHQTGKEKPHQAIIYVQLVTVSGLKLQYEIKTSLDISQCSFVWKEGYYNAIFLSTNRKDHQSEILSLRLVDSRLELMARVPGVINSARHKKQLIVAPELRVAALSTNQGTFVVDLEDNRVSQSLRRHQSPPTLLWA